MHYKIPSQTIFRAIEGEAIALNLNTGQYYSMNEIGTQMWLLLQEGRTPTEVTEKIAAEYDAGREDIQRDLDLFLENLQASGLIEKA